MTDTEFPTPFGGIRCAIGIDHDELVQFLAYVAGGCDKAHDHNLAVEFDHTPPRVWGSELLSECYREFREAVHA